MCLSESGRTSLQGECDWMSWLGEEEEVFFFFLKEETLEEEEKKWMGECGWMLCLSEEEKSGEKKKKNKWLRLWWTLWLGGEE